MQTPVSCISAVDIAVQLNVADWIRFEVVWVSALLCCWIVHGFSQGLTSMSGMGKPGIEFRTPFQYADIRNGSCDTNLLYS